MTESEAIEKVKENLTSDLLKSARSINKMVTGDKSFAGFCYISSEAFYYLMGGSLGDWESYHINHEGESHWLLKNKVTNEFLDITANQFKTPVPYHKARRRAFLTKYPSKRCKIILDRIQEQTKQFANKTVCVMKGVKISTDIKLQIKALKRVFLHDESAHAAIKYILLGKFAYLKLRSELEEAEEADARTKGIDFHTAGIWPEEFEGCYLVVDPLDDDREALVVCDPIQEILMRVR